MFETDASTPKPRDVIRAATLLTRIPLPGGDGTRGAEAAWAWPVVGLGIALIQNVVGLCALALNLPVSIAAGLALAVGFFATGGLHEDGLADCADGFWGGATRVRRLEILKDSRIGSYGVLAMIVAVGLRWMLFATLLPGAPLALVAAAMLSRAGMAAVMAALPFAREDGLAAHVGKPPNWAVGLGMAIAVIGAALTAGPAVGLISTLAMGLGALGVAAIARSKIGGQTGDVLGTAQVVGELFALMTCAALLT